MSHHYRKLYTKLKLIFRFCIFSDALSNAQWLITDFKLSGSGFLYNSICELYGNVEGNHNDIKPIIRFPDQILEYVCQFLAVLQQSKLDLVRLIT